MFQSVTAKQDTGSSTEGNLRGEAQGKRKGLLKAKCKSGFHMLENSGIWAPDWWKLSFPGDLAGKESVCSVGDLGLVPGLGRSPGEGNSLPTPVFWPGEFHGLYSPWGLQESDTMEQISLWLLVGAGLINHESAGLMLLVFFQEVVFAAHVNRWLRVIKLILSRVLHLPAKSHGQRSLVGCSLWGR